MEPSALIRPRNKVVREPICNLGSVHANTPDQMHHAPKGVRSVFGRTIQFDAKGHRAGGHIKLHVTREYVSEDSRGEPIGISCSKKDSIPNIGIGFSSTRDSESSASNSAGGREKWVGMVVGIIERMMLEQHLPGEGVRTEDPILGIARHNIVPIDRRT